MLKDYEIEIILQQMQSFPSKLLEKVTTLKIDTKDVTEKLFDVNLWWIVFGGVYGCGKTQYITHAVYNYLCETVLQYEENILPERVSYSKELVYYIELDEYFDAVRRSYGDKDYKDDVDYMRDIEILVIDEVREERIFSQDEVKNLEMLANHRHKNGKMTVLITNANNFEFLSGMIRSRINENSFIKLFKNQDRRKQHAK